MHTLKVGIGYNILLNFVYALMNSINRKHERFKSVTVIKQLYTLPLLSAFYLVPNIHFSTSMLTCQHQTAILLPFGKKKGAYEDKNRPQAHILLNFSHFLLLSYNYIIGFFGRFHLLYNGLGGRFHFYYITKKEFLKGVTQQGIAKVRLAWELKTQPR
jgi:hypothetical protein